MRKIYLLLALAIFVSTRYANAQYSRCCQTKECFEDYNSGKWKETHSELELLGLQNGGEQAWSVTDKNMSQMERIEPADYHQRRMPVSHEIMAYEIDEKVAFPCTEKERTGSTDGFAVVGRGALVVNRKIYRDVTKTKKVTVMNDHEHGINYLVEYAWYSERSQTPLFWMEEAHFETNSGASFIDRRYNISPLVKKSRELISVSPNPATEVAIIKIKRLEEEEAGNINIKNNNYRLEVIDLNGIVKTKMELSGQERSVKIDVSGYQIGTYNAYLFRGKEILDAVQVIKQ